jgi:DNA-binding phage protein
MSIHDPIKRLRRPGPGPDEAQWLDQVRREVKEEFPPRNPTRLQPAENGLAARVREARKAKGLTWDAVASRAGLTGADVVRNVECGRDATVADLQAIAETLGLKLELVETNTEPLIPNA